MHLLVENYLQRLTEEGLLTEAPFGAQTLGKYGFKADSMDEATFTHLQGVAKGFPPAKQGQVIRQLGRLYLAEPKKLAELGDLAQRLSRVPNADLNLLVQAPDVTHLHHAVDAAETKSKATQYRSEFNIESTPGDWENERYKVYKAHSQDACIRYGKGYSFCIARQTGGNMYHTYRKRQLAFYYVFDRSLDPGANEYITVVGVMPDGKCEFTHKNNDTETTSGHYHYSLDEFLASKPGLEAARGIFQALPHTKQEKATYKFNDQVANDQIAWNTLTPEQQETYVNHGEGIDSYMWPDTAPGARMAFINRGGALQNSMAQVSTESERRRAANMFYKHRTTHPGPDNWVWRYATPELVKAYVEQGGEIDPTTYERFPEEVKPYALAGLPRLSAALFAKMDPEKRMAYLKKDPLLDDATVALLTPQERDYVLRWNLNVDGLYSHILETLTPEEQVLIGRRMIGQHVGDEDYRKTFGLLYGHTKMSHETHDQVMKAAMTFYKNQRQQQLNESVAATGVGADGYRRNGQPASRAERITRWAQLGGVR